MAKTPYCEPDGLNEDLESTACSAYDCTGLIPNTVTDESQIESYEDLYPFLAPMVIPDSDE